MNNQSRLITPHGDSKPDHAGGRLPHGHRLITPHGDSKRGSRPPCQSSPSELITPHGDSKRAKAGWRSGSEPQPVSHYPSWGFETAHRHTLPLIANSLITPHGDSKPRWANGEGAHYRNSAHYPSWGFETSGSSIGGGLPSSTHYPSWGFETTPDASDPGVCRPSLPLMGIRNASRPRDETRSTPSHYPSWGFETEPRVADGHVHVDLITPHGDSKPARRSPHVRRSGQRGSLPLMGIRNSNATITQWPSARAHYPSWGFETFSVLAQCPIDALSLPLMGIRNRRWRLGRFAYWCSSLPLMGIRNIG